MMKKIYYGTVLFVLTLLLASCTREDDVIDVTVINTNSRAFTFGVYIPEEQIVGTRGEAIQQGMIENLHVLVFDAGGNFLTRAQATPTADPGKYNVLLSPTNPDAPLDERKRILHVICNYDWAGFSDVHHIGKSENEVVGSLSVTGKKIAYWQRMELTNGIVEGAFPSTIELIRNVAKISVNNNSILNRLDSNIADATFALGDYYDYGTIAPFSTSSFTFTEGTVCESPYGTVQSVTEQDFIQTGGAGNTGKSVLCYERRNSISNTPMYIILKGKYSKDGQYYYYKVDIINEGEEVLCDITRNNHYIISIQRVAGPGYATLQEAVDSPASNNLLYSVLLQDYTAISDGSSALRVEMTSQTIVEGNKAFAIGFSYIPDITTGIENNNLVTIELEQDAASQVVQTSSQEITTTVGSAQYKARTVAAVPEYNINTARLVFQATHNGVTLRRVVTLRLRRPSEFEQVYVSPSAMPTTVGEEVNLHFTIPSNIRSSLFPLEVFITTLSLTPNLAYNDQDKLTFDYSKPGVYRYKYIVRDTGDYTLHFKTTSTAINETLIIESDLFTPKEVVLR